MIRLNSKLVRLVELLNDQQFHDGSYLGEKLGISRTAVWKMITKLTEYDIPIIRVKGKGYLLKEPLILLNSKKIKSLLKDVDINTISIFEAMPSTQTYLTGQPCQSSFDICLTEIQTQGRGRLNRSWYSPFGQNIYMSISRLLKKDLSQLNGLTLIIALSLADAIDKFCNFETPILTKWPNDLMYNEKKLAGLLVEVVAESNGFSRIIIGMGVNVNLKKEESRKKINKPWTSLSQINSQYYDRNLLMSAIIHHLARDLVIFEKEGLAAFMLKWKKRDYLYGKSITATVNSNHISGTAMGITPTGHLKIKTKNQVLDFSVGDISLTTHNRA
jgi:BirA family biotin operon repressor/biotin-[acetyl-CoA-carboxylase] ligase